MEYLFLILGFVLLVKGADIFVDGAVAIANKFHIPPFIIGLTILAIGTSLPEASVSINAALNDSNDLVMGNVVGSNMFNVLVVLGIAAMIKPVITHFSTLSLELPLVLLGSSLVLIFSYWLLPNSFLLSRGEGLVFILILVGYIFYLLRKHLSGGRPGNGLPSAGRINVWKQGVKIIVGFAGIVFGGNLVVDSSLVIVAVFGLSESFAGILITALGTSLPELVTSLVAILKNGETDMALGNVIGSNMFNIFFVLGGTACISPISVQPFLFLDVALLSVTTGLVYFFAYLGKKISRLEGGILFFSYILYCIYLFYRDLNF